MFDFVYGQNKPCLLDIVKNFLSLSFDLFLLCVAGIQKQKRKSKTYMYSSWGSSLEEFGIRNRHQPRNK